MSSTQKFAERAPTLWIHPEAFEKIMQYIQLCPVEINGFGYLTVHDRHTLVLSSPEDVFITQQVVSMGSADVDASTVGLAMARAAEEERGSDLRLQWHSHVHGQAFFSSTDTGTIDSYGDSGSTWMVSMVLNKRGEFSARLDMFSPLRSAVEMQVLMLPFASDYSDQCRHEMKQLVQKKVMRPKPKRAKGLPLGFPGVATDGDFDEEVAAWLDEDDEPDYDLIGVFEDPPTRVVSAAKGLVKRGGRP